MQNSMRASAVAKCESRCAVSYNMARQNAQTVQLAPCKNNLRHVGQHVYQHAPVEVWESLRSSDAMQHELVHAQSLF
jgi:hypothetical protein